MNKVRVLIVDDDEGVRIVIPKMLASLGVTVLTASSFSAAIMLMAEVPPPDFIFLDLGLPDTPSKLKTLEHIPDLKAFNPSAPIVVLTGDPDEKLEQIAKTLGADAYRRKTDLNGQKDLWLSMKEAIEMLVAKGATPTEAMTKIMHAITTRLSAVLLIAMFLLAGCSQYAVKGQLRYEGQYGTYGVSSDGKAITYDVQLKNPKGYAK